MYFALETRSELRPRAWGLPRRIGLVCWKRRIEPGLMHTAVRGCPKSPLSVSLPTHYETVVAGDAIGRASRIAAFLGCLGSVELWGKRGQRAATEAIDTVDHNHWLIAQIQGRPRLEKPPLPRCGSISCADEGHGVAR